MIDLIFPENDDERFMLFAKKLGFEKVYVPGKNLRRDEIMNCTNAPDKTRHAIEKSDIKIFYNLEVHHDRDGLHQRKSGFNHVLAALAHDKEKIIAFNFNTVLQATGATRSVLLGRMRQNVTLCRKYKVSMMIMSGATTPYEMRSGHDLIAFGELLGMMPNEAKKAMNGEIN